MTVSFVDNINVFFGGYDLTSDTNQLDVGSATADVKDKTNMGSLGWTEGVIGLKRAQLQLMTMLNTANGEVVLSTAPGLTFPLTAIDSSGTAASVAVASDPAVFTNALCTKMEMPFKVGEIAMLNGDFTTKGPVPLIDGKVLLPQVLTGTGANGSAVTLGAVASGRSVYAAFHVFGVAGSSTPTMLCKVQSAPLSNFASPTDRITFTNATAVGAELKSTAGAITDTFWRVVYSFTGTTPVFGAAVVAGIA